MRVSDSTSNRTAAENKVLRAEAALKDALAKSLQRGFYGTAGIVVSIQDGAIQNVRLTVDQRVL